MRPLILALALAACTGRAPPPPVPVAVAAPERMPEPGRTEQGPTLHALGVDPAHLPPLHDVPEAAVKPLMNTFDDSLDACCEDCHVKNDPKAPTDAKRISAEMWHRYSQDLETVDGEPVYCDSCHKGRLRFLDRSNREALSQWMRVNYVDRLRAKDGSRMECPTCHGRPFEPKIFDRLWRKG